jgi:hypothetical protein
MEDEPEEVYDHDAYNQLKYAAHWPTSTGNTTLFFAKSSSM